MGVPNRSHHFQGAQPNNTSKSIATVISSWALVSVISRGPESFDKSVLPALSAGLRGALADALEVCRPCVSVQSLFPSTQSSLGDGSSLIAHGAHRTHRTTLADVMRKGSLKDDLRPVKFSQVEITYEVRVEEAMGYSDADIAIRVDGMQLYSKFADLNMLLRRWLDGDPAPQGILELAFSDLGYASRRLEYRPPFSTEQAQACVEEGLLRSAKLSHQYVVAAAMMISVMTACVGSLVFAIKAPTHIPSRMNPLMPAVEQ